jgi:hypothetical protein
MYAQMVKVHVINQSFAVSVAHHLLKQRAIHSPVCPPAHTETTFSPFFRNSPNASAQYFRFRQPQLHRSLFHVSALPATSIDLSASSIAIFQSLSIGFQQPYATTAW